MSACEEWHEWYVAGLGDRAWRYFSGRCSSTFLAHGTSLGHCLALCMCLSFATFLDVVGAVHSLPI